MCAKLVAYEYVPLRYEIVVKNTDVEMGKIPAGHQSYSLSAIFITSIGIILKIFKTH